jgi:hypothetical protein
MQTAINDSSLAQTAHRRLLPIVAGGVTIALAENLPGFSLLDWVCCGTIWSGALLAVYLSSRQNPRGGVSFREAVAVGILAAFIGAILNLTVDFVFKKSFADSLRFFSRDPAALTETLRKYLQQPVFERMPFLLQIMFVAVSLVIHLTVGAIGGMMGAVIFPPQVSTIDDEHARN